MLRHRLIASTVAVLLALAVPTMAGAYTVVDYGDQDRNGVTESWVLDDDGDGIGDRLVIDGNQDGRIELELRVTTTGVTRALWLDSNLDGYWDVVLEPWYANAGRGHQIGNMVWRDFDQNNLWENAYYDGNLDGVFEWVKVDTNYDGVADDWRANAAPPGRSATDIMARSIGEQTAFQILVQGGASPFANTVWPIGG